MQPRHTLVPGLDRRLISYAAMSWNAYEAVYGLQQLTSLLPGYTKDLEALYGPAGLGDARRAWGVAADLVAAMASAPPTMQTLIDFGFTDVVEVGHLIGHSGEFALATSPVLRRLDFRAAILGDLGPALVAAVAHDSVAKPLLEAFQAEIRIYDQEAASNHHISEEPQTFRDLLRALPDAAKVFPLWDSRPMFLDEQKALLDYIAKNVGTEIVADALVDGPLGEFLLRESGIIHSSNFSGEPVFELSRVPNDLLQKPVELICHQAGNAVLNALKPLPPEADVLHRLFITETAVFAGLGLDISQALASTRALAVERQLKEFVLDMVDIRNEDISALSAQPYDFPDLQAPDA